MTAAASGPSGPAERTADLSGPEADELLRPAAELAIEVARVGDRQQPPLEVPSQLRPLLRFAKLTNRALTTARRVVEEDPAFRSRVVTAAALPDVDAAIGRAGVLWLRRPEGWEVELAALVTQARQVAAATAEDVEERTAQRRLRKAEAARERADRTAADARQGAEAARLELQEERRLRRAAEDNADGLARRAASLEEQLAAARRRAEAAAALVAERGNAEASAAAALVAAEADLRGLRGEVADLRSALAERAAAAVAVDADARAEGPDEIDRRALGDAVAAASAAAVALGAALARAAAALEPDGDRRQDEAPTDDDLDDGAQQPAGGATTQPRWVRRQVRTTARRPPPLPPGIHDDSAEAAQHLVSLPNVALLVDGYNATISTWPGLPLPEQRLRLIDAMAELAARTGARPEVVFDGADVATDHTVTRTVRSLVKVSFTAPDVEADDVLIARAAALPLPVVVASDDRRVREGARAAGANVLGIEQLLAALRRKS